MKEVKILMGANPRPVIYMFEDDMPRGHCLERLARNATGTPHAGMSTVLVYDGKEFYLYRGYLHAVSKEEAAAAFDPRLIALMKRNWAALA